MPTFPTPGPVGAVVDVPGATLRVLAAEVSETAVEVRPHNPGRSGDVDLAARTTVELVDGHLSVRTPRTTLGRLRSLVGPGGDRVDVELTVPTGSSLQVRGWGEVTTQGRLGDVDLDTAMGDVDLDRVGRARVRLSMGDVRLLTADGPADLRTSCGAIRVGTVGGEVLARTSAGDVRVDSGEHGMRLRAPSGDIVVERAAGEVHLHASSGDVRVQHAGAGTVHVECTYGRVDLGIAEDLPAWLDVDARRGVVRSSLTDSSPPGEGEPSVQVHVVAGYGDVVLHRA